MKKYRILFAAVCMQLCLGATYSWSVYVQPLKKITGLAQGPVQLPFSVFYFAFPAVMILSGTLLPRLGPKRSAVFGGFLFGCGWLSAALGSVHFAFTVLGIGLVAGVGVGFAYIVPIATCIKWFPENKGLVTGVAVAGFGGGAAGVSQLGGFLIGGFGWTPFEVFALLGVVFLFVVTLSGRAMENPPRQEPSGADKSGMPLRDIMGKRVFWILYGAMMVGLSAGFTVNANLRELFPGGRIETGIAAVSLFAIANAAGRLAWGAVFDRIRPATAIGANLLLQALCLFSAGRLVQSAYGFMSLAVLTGFGYGGVLVLYVSAASQIWGGNRVGQVYGWLFSSNIPAALSPVLAGLTFDRTGAFMPFLAGIGVLLTLAALTVGVASKRINA